MDLFELIQICLDIDILLGFLKEKGLIRTSYQCEDCPRANSYLEKDSTRKDKYWWRCHGCKNKYSIRKGSFFSSSKLELRKIVLLIYCWTHSVSNTKAQIFCSVSKQTITDWYNFCRDICSRILLRQQQPTGGVGDIIEIDESKFRAKRKYARGRRLTGGQWVFGGICRRTKKSFARIVDDRSKKTLIPIIKSMISPGSIIYSDDWGAYKKLNKIGYHHEVVNHSKEFVRADNTTIHTNTIEHLWGEWKAVIKTMRGVKGGYY